MNLVFCKGSSSKKQEYLGLRYYKLEGETETSIVYLADETKDSHSFIAELYQFTSNGRAFDLDIVFERHKGDLEVEGILFQPLKKVSKQIRTYHVELGWEYFGFGKVGSVCVGRLRRWSIKPIRFGLLGSKNIFGLLGSTRVT